MKKVVLPLIAVASLTGCDVAADLAGDAIAEQVRTQYLAQCESVAEGVGISSDRITSACDCSADEFAADLEQDGELQIDQARIEEVLRTCVQDGQDTPADAPAETVNG